VTYSGNHTSLPLRGIDHDRKKLYGTGPRGCRGSKKGIKPLEVNKLERKEKKLKTFKKRSNSLDLDRVEL